MTRKPMIFFNQIKMQGIKASMFYIFLPLGYLISKTYENIFPFTIYNRCFFSDLIKFFADSTSLHFLNPFLLNIQKPQGKARSGACSIAHDTMLSPATIFPSYKEYK